jgi:sugar lactone lactonase YvrE
MSVPRIPETVARGIAFPEGLGWSSGEQALFCSGCQDACVYRFDPARQVLERIADLGGGANNLVLTEGGGFLVAQNGGIDSNPGMRASFPQATPGPEIRQVTPGLVHVAADGSAAYVVDSGLNAPNDIAVAADGRLFITDPGNPYSAVKVAPRVMTLSPEHELSVFAIGFEYCNGIAVGDDAVFVTDHGGVIRLGFDGSREWAAAFEGGCDGLALDAEGRLYVTGQRDGNVRVFEAGQEVEELRVAPSACATNCCFGGSDLRDLYVCSGNAIGGHQVQLGFRDASVQRPHSPGPVASGNAERHVRVTQPCVLCHDRDVREEGDAEAGTGRGTVDGRHHGLLESDHAFDEL